MIEFYFAERKLHGGGVVPVEMFRFHTGIFRIVNNQPKEDILEGEVDEATKKAYPKEYDLFINGVPKSEESLIIEPVEEKEHEDIAPEITRASFFDEENDEEKEQEIFIKGK